MKKLHINLLLLGAAVLLAGCGNIHRQGLAGTRLQQVQDALARGGPQLSPELQSKILALNPTNVSARDVRDVLALAPAPRIIKIHGGLARVIPRMVSFSEFLIGMGYPAASLTNPGDGTYSFSCYESSEMIAGAIAWYYEQEGLRPMLVGHSQGGMQVVKVLHRFSGKPSGLRVWNPLSCQWENRCEIVDPHTTHLRPASQLRLPYATAVGAGGLTRLLPNQWDMMFRLHSIPDSVEEFTGFCKERDLLGGDFLGYGSVNHFKPKGAAVVRNVWLPASYKHGSVPDTKHLLKDPRIVDWIHDYHPAGGPVVKPKPDEPFAGDGTNILWAADVWYSIKKHWVQELQANIRAGRAQLAGKGKGKAGMETRDPKSFEADKILTNYWGLEPPSLIQFKSVVQHDR